MTSHQCMVLDTDQPYFSKIDKISDQLKLWTVAEVREKANETINGTTVDILSDKLVFLIVPDFWDGQLPQAFKPFVPNLKVIPWTYIVHNTEPPTEVELFTPSFDAAERFMEQMSKKLLKKHGTQFIPKGEVKHFAPSSRMAPDDVEKVRMTTLDHLYAQGQQSDSWLHKFDWTYHSADKKRKKKRSKKKKSRKKKERRSRSKKHSITKAKAKPTSAASGLQRSRSRRSRVRQ